MYVGAKNGFKRLASEIGFSQVLCPGIKFHFFVAKPSQNQPSD
jgi:hypothetical protein